MAYKYFELKSLTDAHEDEKVCAVYENPMQNFTAIATSKELIDALDDPTCKLVVWRDEDNENYYVAINEFGQAIDKNIERKEIADMRGLSGMVTPAWKYQQKTKEAKKRIERPKELIGKYLGSIEKAANKGENYVTVIFTEGELFCIKEVVEAFEEAGFKVERKDPQPIPPGCPSDQWDPYRYLTISWKEKEN